MDEVFGVGVGVVVGRILGDGSDGRALPEGQLAVILVEVLVGRRLDEMCIRDRRISDHCSNIAARLVGMEAGEDYDSHTLKNMMHHNPTKEYMLNYEQCRKDYLIPLEQLEA